MRFHHDVHKISIYLQAYELFISRFFSIQYFKIGADNEYLEL